MLTKNFEIYPVYLTDVIDYREWGSYDGIPPEKLTKNQVVKILQGQDRCSIMGSRDHPEFAALRDHLEQSGYIKTERQWWNGDRVLRPFRLNDCLFRRDEQFPSAAAMSGHLKYRHRNNLSERQQ